MTTESATVLAMRQLVAEADRSPFGRSRFRRQALERLTALRERRAARWPAEPTPAGATEAITAPEQPSAGSTG